MDSNNRKQSLWYAAEDQNEMGYIYFGRKELELDLKGFTVLDSFLADQDIPNTEYFELKTANNPVTMMAEHVMENLPG